MASELLIYFPLRHCLQIYHLIGFRPGVTRVRPQKKDRKIDYFWKGQTRKREFSFLLEVVRLGFFYCFSLIFVEKYHKLCHRVEVNTFLSSHFSSYLQQELGQDFMAVQGSVLCPLLCVGHDSDGEERRQGA